MCVWSAFQSGARDIMQNADTMLTAVRLVFFVLCCTFIQARNFPISNELDALPWRDEDEVCTTSGCKQAAQLLLQSINASVEPCEDFYEFSCGGWMAKHPVPPTESQWSQFNLIDTKLDHQLRDILSEAEDPEDPAPVNWAKTMYKACMDTERMEERGAAPLAGLLEELGGWPMASDDWEEHAFSWPRVLAASTRRFAVTPLLAVYVYLDRKDSNRSVVTVDQSTLVLPRAMLTDPLSHAHMLSSYAEWMVESGREVARANKQRRVSLTSLYVEALEVVDFEIELAQFTTPSEDRRDPYRMYNSMSLQQLQKWSDSAAHEKPQIQWESFLRDLFADTDVKVSPGERVIVKELEFILKLVALLEDTPPRTVANYLMWRLVRHLSRETTQHMRDLSFKFDKIYSGVKEDMHRWRECVSRVNNALPFAAGYKYVQRHFDDSAKSTALAMVAHIQRAFKARVAAATWMDENTRRAASSKADSMAQFIGFPDWLHNKSALAAFYHGMQISENHFENVEAATSFQVQRVFNKLRKPTDRSEWVSGPAVVNAYYNPLTNSITFPAGILQAPFFAKDAIEALNYGSIGVVIGHEITHGFDDMGRHSDALGNLAQWWSDETIAEYLELAQCFVQQYDAFPVPQLEDVLGEDASVNGVTTQGENIADNGGLRQAFHAYQRFVQEHGPEPRLPGLQQFSPEQLFFLGFATVWCESPTRESLLHEVLADPHAPHRYRVLGSVVNSPEFADAWSCPRGSRMNPGHKCRIW